MSLTDTALQLGRLSAGERAWFWFTSTPRQGARLRISRVTEDPLGKNLFAKTKGAADLESTPITGFVQVDEGGRLHFASERGSEKVLHRIAEMVCKGIQDYPQLGRLCNASYTIVYDGIALMRFEDKSLWEGIEVPSVQGTLTHTSMVLSRLKPGERAFFWTTAHGPEDTPLLLLGLAEDDPTGEAFANVVRAARRRCGKTSEDIVGVVTVLKSGRLYLTTEQDAPPLRPIVTQLLRGPTALPELSRAVFVGPNGRTSLEAAQLDEEFFTSSVERAVYFWLTDVSVHGNPQLVLGQDKVELKERARIAQGKGRRWRGRVQHTNKTVLIIRDDPEMAQKALNGFLQRMNPPRPIVISTGRS